MFGWIVGGISSLFEPVSGQQPAEWPGEGAGSAGSRAPLPGARTRTRAGTTSSTRAAKRNYQSVDVADGVCHSEQVEAKRRRRDVVIQFVKKTVAGVARLLRLRKRLMSSSEKSRQLDDETQPVTLKGIDELHTSWLSSAEWRMDKPGLGLTDRGAKNPFQSSSPPLMRKYSGSAGSAGLPDWAKDRERRSSLQLLPSRPAVRVGTSSAEQAASGGFGHGRCYKPSLTVEETIKQNNKEHYRRLLEMVTEKYNKSQPLPFNQSKPQDVSLSQSQHRAAAPGRAVELAAKKTGHAAAPNVFTWRNASAAKEWAERSERSERWGSSTMSKAFVGALEESNHARCSKKAAAEVDLSTEVATRLNLVDRETPGVSLSDTHTPSRHADDDVPRLTKEMAAEVSAALAQSDPNLVLSSAFKLRITQRDLATLQDGGWLNDEVMNFYLSLVMEQSSDQSAGLRVYSFSTFFFPKLRGGGGGRGGGHEAVKRWTKAVDLFLYDLILVPLHLGVHWAVAVIDLKAKTVQSYDSMGQRHDDVCRLLLLYLKEEHKAKKGRELDAAKWSLCSLRPTDVPQQKNGSDCGVFACKYAHYIAKGRAFTFRQCHMPLFRKLMIWEILHQKLL